MCRTHKDEYKKTFRSSFCLRVSQVFELSGLFLPSTVVPHAFRREASCLPPERHNAFSPSGIITISTSCVGNSRESICLWIAKVSLFFSSSSATYTKRTHPPFSRLPVPRPNMRCYQLRCPLESSSSPGDSLLTCD